MLFEKLVEQHRIDRLIANGNDFALLVARHQIRIYGGHVLGDKAKIRRARGINLPLVAEANRFKREKRFAGLIHRFDVVLVASRGDLEAKFAAGAYSNEDAVSLRRRADVSDPGDVALASKTYDVLADTDITISRDIETGLKAQGNVRAAGYVLIECMATDGRVEDTCCVVNECIITVGRVVVTSCVGKERLKTGGRVVKSGCVAK